MENQEGKTTQEGQEEVKEYKPLDENALDDMDFDELKALALERDKDASTYHGKMKHWRSKAQKPKEEAPEVNKDNKPKDEPEDDLKADVASLKLSEKKREFGYDKDLSPKEVDSVVRFAGPDGDWDKALEDPFVKAGLDSLRKSKKVEEATPKSSGSPMTVVAEKSRDKMTDKDKQEAFDNYKKGKFGK